MTLEGADYLIPVTGFNSTSASIAIETFVALDYILDLIANCNVPYKGPLIVILDCCRTELMIRGKVSQYTSIKANSNCSRPNTCIVYATSGNQVAQDGTGSDHGVFTQRLLNFMDSDENVDKVFKNIQSDLQDIYKGEQVCCRA